jgi:PleD family two-component response regulator
MEVSNTVAIVGIIFSLAIFCLVLRHAVLGQRLKQLSDNTLTSPKTQIITAAPPSMESVPPRLNRSPSRNEPGLERSSQASMGRSDIKLLAISNDRGSRERLRELAKYYGWDLFLCSNCERAESIFRIESVPIVLCDCDTLNINWRDAFRIIRRSDPSRCVILCSKADDDYLWHEVVRRGGYDIIGRPLREEQVVRTVKFAWAFWKTVHCSSIPAA